MDERTTARQTNDDEHRLDDIALERLRGICLSFPDAEEDDLQDRPLFHVRRRRFALFNGATSPPRSRWHGSGRSVHFLADAGELDALLQDGRFEASPHHGDRGWVALRLDRGDPDWTELAELLEAAHRRVAPR